MQFIHKLKTKSKIMILLTTLIIGMILLGITANVKMGEIGAELKNIAENDIPLTNVVSEIELLQAEQALLVERVQRYGGVTGSREETNRELIKAEKEFLQLAHHADKEIIKGEELLKKILASDLSSMDRAEMEKVLAALLVIQKEHTEFEHHVEQLFDAVNGARIHEANKIARVIAKEEEDLAKETKDLYHEIAGFTAQAALNAKHHEEAGELTILLVTIFFTLLGIAIGLITSQLITLPLGGEPMEMQVIAEQVAKGDLGFQFESRGDRASLYNSLKKMTDDLNLVISRISGNSGLLANSSTELSAVSAQLANAAVEMSGQTETVAGSSEQINMAISTLSSSLQEMSASIQSIAAASTEVSQNMDFVNDSIQNMSQGISSISEESSKAVEISKKAHERSAVATIAMSDLSQSAGEIGEVSNMIKVIAQQTNLLALNANIEAASAGEAGKGFAVVANEIKELAKQSGTAAEDIAKKILGIQQNTNNGVNTITEMVKVIQTTTQSSAEINKSATTQTASAQEVAGSVREATMGIQDIARLIEEMAQTSTEVAGGSEQVAQGSLEISSNISGISAAAREASAGANQIMSESKGLSQMAEELKGLTDQFILSESAALVN